MKLPQPLRSQLDSLPTAPVRLRRKFGSRNHYQVPRATIAELTRAANECSREVRLCINRNQPTLAGANALIAFRLRTRIIEILEALQVQQ